MSKGASQSSLTFAEYVRSFSDQRRIQKISALLAQLILFVALSSGALLTFLGHSSVLFIFSLFIGSMSSFVVYWAYRLTAMAMQKRKLHAAYAEFLHDLCESERAVAFNCFSNLISLGFSIERQSRFLLNIVSESFEYNKESLQQIMTICKSGKVQIEPDLAWLLEEAAVAVERMFILFQAGLYEDEPLRSIVVPDILKRLSDAENFALFIEKVLLFEKEIVSDLKETVQFCLNVIGLSETKSRAMIQKYLDDREVRRKKMHESFYEFMLSMPKAPIDFSNS